jgi:hypothetical protein
MTIVEAKQPRNFFPAPGKKAGNIFFRIPKTPMEWALSRLERPVAGKNRGPGSETLVRESC